MHNSNIDVWAHFLEGNTISTTNHGHKAKFTLVIILTITVLSCYLEMIFSRMNSMKFKQKEVARIQKKVHWTLWVSACLYWLVKVCLYGLVTTLQVPVALSLVAGGDLDVPHALLALHVAAPVELALAPLCPPLPPRGVAPVAAQQVAAIDPLGSL